MMRSMRASHRILAAAALCVGVRSSLPQQQHTHAQTHTNTNTHKKKQQQQQRNFLPAVIAVCEGSDDSSKKRRLTMPELRDTLKLRLEEVREEIKKKGRFYAHFPPLILRSDKSTVVCEVQLDSFQNRCPNVLGCVSKWLQCLEGEEEEEESGAVAAAAAAEVTTTSSTTSSDNGDTDRILSFVSKKRDASITVLAWQQGTRITIFKDGGFTQEDVDRLVAGYHDAFSPANNSTGSFGGGGGGGGGGSGAGFPPTTSSSSSSLDESKGTNNSNASSSSARNPINELEQLGVKVFDKVANTSLDWSSLAGAEKVQSEIEEAIVLVSTHPAVLNRVARQTREVFEPNRPKAILFEGPPGTGKTLTARILASRIERPLVHLKLETIVSKWYGESEKKLAKILDACEALGETIIFIDEIDALATSRDSPSGMHEATRRILSVILQRLDGFEGKSKTLLVCATNRRQDLDPALLSRFDLQLTFPNPNKKARKAIFSRYARQLDESALQTLAASSKGLSCRDIKEACEQAERKYTAALIASFPSPSPSEEELQVKTPPLETYVSCIEARKTLMVKGGNKDDFIGHI